MEDKIKDFFSNWSGSDGLIDLHTHLLPDWDDGPKSWEEAKKMVELAVADGITAICLTPHIFRFSRYQDNQQVLEQRFHQFYERFGSDSRISFFRGAEVFVHQDMVQEIKSRNLSVNQSEYVFVEFPSDQVPAGARELFYRLMLAGYTPIISHPERNEFFGRQPEMLYDFINRGCLAQLTAGSLVGRFGREVQKRAELFLKHHLVQLMASDAHDIEKRPPVLSQGLEAAIRLIDREIAEAMVNRIPKSILSNQLVPELERPTPPLRHRFFFPGLKKVKNLLKKSRENYKI